MNRLRLLFQFVLGMVARTFGINDKLSQFCDRCGRTHYLSFWSTNEVWIAVAGNVNGHQHGAYCIACFHYIARQREILLDWTPTIIPNPDQTNHPFHSPKV